MGEPVFELDRTPGQDRSEDDGTRPLRLQPTESLLGENIALAEAELHRRLSNSVRAAKISDQTLARMLVELCKLRDHEASDSGERRGRTMNVLAIVQQEGLPLERQIGLVMKAMEQAREAGEPIEQFEQAIRQLAPNRLLTEGADDG